MVEGEHCRDCENPRDFPTRNLKRVNMSLRRDWLRNAFAVNPQQEAPTEEQRELLKTISREIVKRGMTAPALAFLEMSRPMNFLGAQAMHFFAPLLTTIFDARGYEQFSLFLERRDSIDLWCEQIEEIVNEPIAAPPEPEPPQTP